MTEMIKIAQLKTIVDGKKINVYTRLKLNREKCAICGYKNNGNGNIELHHVIYDEKHPEYYTIPLCKICHALIHLKGYRSPLQILRKRGFNDINEWYKKYMECVKNVEKEPLYYHKHLNENI